MKKLIKIAALCALATLLCISAYAREALFDPTIEVEETADTITVTVQSDADTNSILAEKQPTLSIPCNFSAAEVTFGGKVIDSTLENGEVSFTVAAGGKYVITKTTPPGGGVPEVTEQDEEEENTATNSTDVEEYAVPDFTDVEENDWFYEDVQAACRMGLMIGTSENTFDPDDTGSRGTVLTMLARYAGVDTENGSIWYEKGVAWAVEKGISDGSNPEDPVTREQIVTMLYRFLGGTPGRADVLKDFTDAGSVSEWAKDAMTWAVENGILLGYGNGELNPLGVASRAEIAALFVRALGQ